MERSRRILEISYHQNLDQFHKILDPLPVVYFLQVIPSILPLIITDSSTLHICKIIRSILLAFSGLMTLIIDTVFLASFAKYLHLSAIGGVLDHRYEITSHYGIASCLCCYLVLILYVTGTSMGAPESDMGEVLVTVSSIFLDLVLVISFLLKISLNQIGFDDHPSSDTESCLEGEKGVAGVKWIHHVSVPTPSQRDARISDDGRISRVFYQLE
ncbi:hypothetical protein BDR26DRAFT_874023 [Obelidium mucronatum]|nr:hypothetical protein BDR26DRAFT_874023 [Obelidium mucronatum]